MTHQEFINQYLPNIDWHIKDGILYVGAGTHFTNHLSFVLPDNIHFNYFISFQDTNLKKISRGFSYGGHLNLQMLGVIEIPDDFNIGGNIFLSGTKLRGSEIIQKKLISKGRDYYSYVENLTDSAMTLHKLLWEL